MPRALPLPPEPKTGSALLTGEKQVHSWASNFEPSTNRVPWKTEQCYHSCLPKTESYCLQFPSDLWKEFLSQESESPIYIVPAANRYIFPIFFCLPVISPDTLTPQMIHISCQSPQNMHAAVQNHECPFCPRRRALMSNINTDISGGLILKANCGTFFHCHLLQKKQSLLARLSACRNGNSFSSWRYGPECSSHKSKHYTLLKKPNCVLTVLPFFVFKNFCNTDLHGQTKSP